MAEQEWQPIETAPKDEADILLWGPLHGATVACWEADTPISTGWVTFEGNIYHPVVFTHWMPLPSPPIPHSTAA